MTREQFAKRIGWSWIIWTTGFVNAVAMLPQLYRLVTTRQTEGLALETFWLYFVIQIVFSLHGFFNKDRMLMVCLGLSAVVSALIIGTVIYLRFTAA